MQTQQNDPTIDYDIAISGGGVVGCLAALALSKHSHLKIALFEAFAQAANKKGHNKAGLETSQFDERVIALAGESLLQLTQLGVDIDQVLGQDIEHIHVSDKGHIGQVCLSAAELRQTRLGKVVAIKALGEHLLARVKACSNVDYFAPASIQHLSRYYEYMAIDVLHNEQVHKLHSKLLLVCDGNNAATSSILGLSKQQQDYGQTAIITNVRMQLAHNNTAYERFTAQGPIAFLPMYGKESQATDKSSLNKRNANTDYSDKTMSVVWCMHTHKVAAAMALDDANFIAALQPLFGHKLGNIEAISQRISYPLILSETPDYVSHRALCLGNAAQSLHPIAGQGFNLGIRDVFDLVQSIDAHADVGSFANLQAYKQGRASDKAKTIQATSGLVKVFSNQYWPLVMGRNLGLLAMNKNNLAKQAFANFAMGKRN